MNWEHVLTIISTIASLGAFTAVAHASFKAGKVIQSIDDLDRRILRIEEHGCQYKHFQHHSEVED